jgi:hypothetical protein
MAIETALFFETPEQIYARVFRELRPRSPLPLVQVEFCRFANARSTVRWEEGTLRVRMTDVVAGAPAPVLEALAFILLSKMFRRSVPAEYAHRYRRYFTRGDVRRHLQQVNQERGRKLILAPQGDAYDLERIFEDLNFQYFHGLMAHPVLGWSRKASRTALGHYDAAHHTIVISKLLDREEVPPLAVEYVMFHEMLHLRHPAEHRGERRCVHTPDFKAAEKQFPRLAEARRILARLPRS